MASSVPLLSAAASTRRRRRGRRRGRGRPVASSSTRPSGVRTTRTRSRFGRAVRQATQVRVGTACGRATARTAAAYDATSSACGVASGADDSVSAVQQAPMWRPGRQPPCALRLAGGWRPPVPARTRPPVRRRPRPPSLGVATSLRRGRLRPLGGFGRRSVAASASPSAPVRRRLTGACVGFGRLGCAGTSASGASRHGRSAVAGAAAPRCGGRASAAETSLRMSIRQPVSLAASRAFWPSRPMASESIRSGTVTLAIRCSSSMSTLTDLRRAAARWRRRPPGRRSTG